MNPPPLLQSCYMCACREHTNNGYLVRPDIALAQHCPE
uniref:Uncharacterized protein n=1 Tax=Arundo donax TaxID=35708 RepID=A0A0A9B0S6_ARUDO